MLQLCHLFSRCSQHHQAIFYSFFFGATSASWILTSSITFEVCGYPAIATTKNHIAADLVLNFKTFLHVWYTQAASARCAPMPNMNAICIALPNPNSLIKSLLSGNKFTYPSPIIRKQMILDIGSVYKEDMLGSEVSWCNSTSLGLSRKYGRQLVMFYWKIDWERAWL